eukprot:5026188-Prymnesium_polylepis.1
MFRGPRAHGAHLAALPRIVVSRPTLGTCSSWTAYTKNSDFGYGVVLYNYIPRLWSPQGPGGGGRPPAHPFTTMLRLCWLCALVLPAAHAYGRPPLLRGIQPLRWFSDALASVLLYPDPQVGEDVAIRP